MHAPGIDSVIPPAKLDHMGERMYSRSMNANAALDLDEGQGLGMRKVFFPLYCDDTKVKISGSQPKNIVRVRFDNIRGLPSYIVESHSYYVPRLRTGYFYCRAIALYLI